MVAFAPCFVVNIPLDSLASHYLLTVGLATYLVRHCRFGKKHCLSSEDYSKSADLERPTKPALKGGCYKRKL